MISGLQIVKNNGIPVAAVLPWAEYEKLVAEAMPQKKEKTIPHEVVEMVVDGDSPIRAWRKYLHMTQAEAAEKMQISQSAFAQMEKVRKSQKTTLRNVAKAFGLAFEQLDLL
nr:MAG TPA: helix-turn-helix domain protein [Caudoviricetes sp.]